MKKKVLVADDDYFIRSLLFLFLREKYEVTTFGNGMDVLMWLEDGNTPDVILTDIEMPEIDGIELLTQLKKSGFYREIPVIILTGHKGEELTKKLRSSGASDFITKPFNPANLLIYLESMFVKHGVVA